MGNKKRQDSESTDRQSDAPLGNRPAQNARIATPGQIGNTNWQGSGAGGDFLGLNADLGTDTSTAAPQPTPAPAAKSTPVAATAATAPASEQASWLFRTPEAQPLVMPTPEPEPEVDATETEPAAEASYLEPAPPVRRMKPLLIKCAAATIVGMIAFAALKMFVFSNHDAPAEVQPLALDSDAVKKPELAKPDNSPLAKYKERRAVAPKGDDSSSSHAESSGASDSNPLVASVIPQVDSADVPPDDGQLSRDAKLVAESGDAAHPGAMPGDSANPTVTPPVQPDPTVETTDSAEEVPEVAVKTPPIIIVHPKPSEAPKSEPASDAKPVTVVEVESSRPTTPEASKPIGEPAEPVASTPVADKTPAAQPSEPTAGAPSAEKNPSADASATSVAVNSKPAEAPAPTEPAIQPSAPKTEGASAAAASGAGSWSGWTAISDPFMKHASRNPAYAPSLDATASTTAPASDSNATKESSVASATGPASKPAGGGAAPKADKSESTGSVDPDTELIDTAGMKRASKRELSNIWSKDTIPFDQIAQPTRLLTPAVGRVRVVMQDNQIFDGTLYSVGENQVTVATDFGRVGLPGQRVAKIERVAPPAKVAGAKGKEGAADGESVRIRTPGGTVMGRILSRDAQKAVILTDDGMRIAFDSKDVEVLGSNPKIAIKP